MSDVEGLVYGTDELARPTVSRHIVQYLCLVSRGVCESQPPIASFHDTRDRRQHSHGALVRSFACQDRSARDMEAVILTNRFNDA